jgi:hypothetical protein
VALALLRCRSGRGWQLLSFARWCRPERIGAVHTCDLYPNIFGLPGAALAGVPVRIGSRRELNPDKSAWQIRMQRVAYRFATTVVANSPEAVQTLKRDGLATASIAVIPNRLDLGSFGDRRPPDAVRTMVTVANLRPELSSALKKTRADHVIVDLVRLKTDRAEIQGQYQGTCW